PVARMRCPATTSWKWVSSSLRVRPMSSGPLSWMRVVDLTDLRGALCARILADFGADVIRVERGEPPESLAHAYRNANKRGVVLDPDDRAALDELLTGADVLVENVGVDAVA